MNVPERLIDPIVLEEFETAVGRVFVQGAGYRVGSLDLDGKVRHMAPAAARRLARELTESANGEALMPVIDALKVMADKVEGLGADLDLADMPALGRA